MNKRKVLNSLHTLMMVNDHIDYHKGKLTEFIEQKKQVTMNLYDLGLKEGDIFVIGGSQHRLIRCGDGLQLICVEFIDLDNLDSLDSGVSNHDAGTNNTNDV